MPTTSTFVTMDDGAKLHVRLVSDDKDTKKPLVLALHGAPGLVSHADSEADLAFLAPQFRVLVYDARGSGESDLTPPYTHKRWIKDIEALRTWAGANKIVLVGHSYGGFIALDYALAHGTGSGPNNHLAGLILRNTWTDGIAGPQGAVARIVSSPRVYGKVDVERQVRVWSGRLRDRDDFAASLAEIASVYLPPDEILAKKRPPPQAPEGNPFLKSLFNHHAQNAAFGENMPAFDVRARLGQINAPTLVVAGRYDIVAPVYFAEDMAAKIPGAQLVIFEESGHNPAQDESEPFQAAVTKFVSSLAD